MCISRGPCGHFPAGAEWTVETVWRWLLPWDVVPCSLVELSWRFRCAYCHQHYRPEDGGRKHFWNALKLLRPRSLSPFKLSLYKRDFYIFRIFSMLRQGVSMWCRNGHEFTAQQVDVKHKKICEIWVNMPLPSVFCGIICSLCAKLPCVGRNLAGNCKSLRQWCR
jgi:hypothetical protein